MITSLIDFLLGVQPDENAIARWTSARWISGCAWLVTLESMHDDAFTKMATMGFTSQLTKLDRRFRAEQA